MEEKSFLGMTVRRCEVEKNRCWVLCRRTGFGMTRKLDKLGDYTGQKILVFKVAGMNERDRDQSQSKKCPVSAKSGHSRSLLPEGGGVEYTSARLQRDLVLEALRMALGRRTPAPGLIHHSDRGSQYASHEFHALLRDHGMACGLSGAGYCFDNAVAESFFATLKRERVNRTEYRTKAEAKTDIFQYIEIVYNRHRRHLSLGHSSPEQLEMANC